MLQVYRLCVVGCRTGSPCQGPEPNLKPVALGFRRELQDTEPTFEARSIRFWSRLPCQGMFEARSRQVFVTTVRHSSRSGALDAYDDKQHVFDANSGHTAFTIVIDDRCRCSDRKCHLQWSGVPRAALRHHVLPAARWTWPGAGSGDVQMILIPAAPETRRAGSIPRRACVILMQEWERYTGYQIPNRIPEYLEPLVWSVGCTLCSLEADMHYAVLVAWIDG